MRATVMKGISCLESQPVIRDQAPVSIYFDRLDGEREIPRKIRCATESVRGTQESQKVS